jgi:hypothetical protein
MTTPERWNEIDRIFAAALDLEPAARPAFLDQACGGDDELREEVANRLLRKPLSCSLTHAARIGQSNTSDPIKS